MVKWRRQATNEYATPLPPSLTGPEAPHLLPLQHGAGGQGTRLRFLGAGVEGVDLLSQGGGAADRALAGQPLGEAVRGQVKEGGGGGREGAQQHASWKRGGAGFVDGGGDGVTTACVRLFVFCFVFILLLRSFVRWCPCCALELELKLGVCQSILAYLGTGSYFSR